MLKLLLERMLPAKPQDDAIAFDLPNNINRAETLFQIGENTIKAVAKGELTPSEAKLVKSHHSKGPLRFVFGKRANQ